MAWHGMAWHDAPLSRLSLSLTHIHKLSLSLSHTHTHARTHTHPLSHTHARPHTPTRPLAYPCPCAQSHDFFCCGDPPIDFNVLTSVTPPPLVPPPPLPSITDGGGTVLNAQLARRGPLPLADRALLLESQAAARWAPILRTEHSELLILASLVLKRRHLSVKRRQLILVEGLVTAAGSSPSPSTTRPAMARASTRPLGSAAAATAAAAATSASASTAARSDPDGPATAMATPRAEAERPLLGCTPVEIGDDGSRRGAEPTDAPDDEPAAEAPPPEYSCRLFYVDPATMENKGSIPWSSQLHAELLPRGQFRIHTPGRTYYLEDAAGDVQMAEQWVQTICDLQARNTPPSALFSPPRLHRAASQDSERRDWDD